MVLAYLLAFVLGALIGYAIFYFRYENRELVVELRNTIKKLNSELSTIVVDHEEHKQQNLIFREKVTELYGKNEDLVGVVSELSRYYYHIKKGSEKVQELAKYLKLPDESIESKMQEYSSTYKKNDSLEQEEKTFF